MLKRVYRGSIRDLLNRRYEHLTESKRVIAGAQIDNFGQVRSACLKGPSVTIFGYVHYRWKLCAWCLWALLKITADFESRYLGEKKDRAFLKLQLKSLWNSTSSIAQQIFFWTSENNTAREELKKKFKIFSNSLPQLQLLAWPRENFSKIWKLYDIESKILSLIKAIKTSKIFMGTRDTIKNVQSCLSWILIDDHGSRPVCCSPPSLRQDRIGHAQRWRLRELLTYPPSQNRVKHAGWLQ